MEENNTLRGFRRFQQRMKKIGLVIISTEAIKEIQKQAREDERQRCYRELMRISYDWKHATVATMTYATSVQDDSHLQEDFQLVAHAIQVAADTIATATATA